MRRAVSLLLLILLARPALAQKEGFLQINDPLHAFLARQQANGHLSAAFLHHLPLSNREAAAYLDSLDSASLSLLDRRLLARYRNDRPHPGATWANDRWGLLYADGATFLSVEGPDFLFEAEPLLYLTAGRVARPTRDDRHETTFQNTRGVRAAGHIGQHLFFESRIEENQRRDAWPDRRGRTAPRLGTTKFYEDSQEYDYWRAVGMLGLRTRHFEIRAGRDRNRWGDGMTSLFLSDYATEYDQLQIRTNVWRLQYVNLFTAWTDFASVDTGADHVLPRKYGAMHSLAIHLPARVQLQLYEAVILAPDYERDRRRGFDFSYLNPIIFYRAVEIERGSPDNMQLGGGASWVPVPGLKVYAQGVLTELNIHELVAGDGWFGNKWGWLAGFHAAPRFAPGLDLHFEHARVRPFTFGHREVKNAFLHYDDALGHPAEQNFFDYALRLRYQPYERWSGTVNAFYTRRGRNPEGENWGADPRLSYSTREADYGHWIGQGIRLDEYRLEAHAGYELLPKMYLEVALRMEQIDDAELGREWYVNPFLQLRWGLPFRSLRY